MKTYMSKASTVERQWFVVDAKEAVLGRLAAKVARVLMGKHKPTYTPHVDTGDVVVVVNCEKIKLTGRKLENKTYRHYTGYQSGLRERAVKDILEGDKPEEVLILAIRRMLPKTRLGRHMLKKLKVYAGPEHPHTAQDPQVLDLSLI